MRVRITTYIDTLVGRYNESNMDVVLNTSGNDVEIYWRFNAIVIFGKYNTLELAFRRDEIGLIDKLVKELEKIKLSLLEAELKRLVDSIESYEAIGEFLNNIDP